MDQMINIEKAKMKLMMSIIGIQNEYSIPSFLMELIISSCLSDIKECVNKDLIILIDGNKENVEKEEQ